MKKIILAILLLIVHCTLYTEHCSAQVWSPLGSGMNGSISGFAIYNNELIAAGYFTTAGGVSANYIAKWNGTDWSQLGSGMNNWVLSLTTYNGDLIAGGFFTEAGGVTANHIAKWNGTNWSALESGINGEVMCLNVYNNELIAGGYFTTAGGVTAIRIAKWDGTNWSSLGSGVSGGVSISQILNLCVYNNNLIACGNFIQAGGLGASNIAKWNGTSWSALGSGIWGVPDSTMMDPAVSALNVYNNELIVGGWYSFAGGYNARGIAKWNGTSWSTLGTGVNSGHYGVNCLATYNNELIVGGYFNNISGFNSKNISKWNGTSWSALGSGTSSGVNELIVFNNQLITGGAFDTVGGVVAHKIAKWWMPFSVSGLVRYSDNNQPATNGYVKAIKLDRSTGNIITFDSAQIQANGSYTLSNVPQDSLDIGVYPNSTTNNDWLITYYPSTTYWQGATTLYPTGNLTNINIGAIRLSATTNSNSVSGKVMRLTDNLIIGNLKDAVLYAKNGNTFVRCGMSDGNGVYHLPSLPAGNLKIICNRIGFTNDSAMVNVTSSGNIDSINFHLYRIPVGIKRISSTIPSEFKLYQNYPNPFNPSTIIRFQIKDSRYTMIKVYNILGKEVTTLVNEKKSPGTYEVTFDGSGLASGIYFYTLSAGDFKATKRFVLIK